MPVEPPPSVWAFREPTRQPGDVVGVGADLEPGTLLAAYRCGIFPMPGEGRRSPLMWFSPVRRGVLPISGMKVSRSLRRSARDFEIRIDSAFDEVVEACADPSRPHGWISSEIHSAYRRLFDLGWAHSVEAWQDGCLAGGLYGVAIGGLFAGESMFHRARDASKVALIGLVSLLRDQHAEKRLLDVQWLTPHLASLGAVEITREEYLGRLRSALDVPLPDRFA